MGALVPPEPLPGAPVPPAPADDLTVDDGHRRGRILRALATCMAEKGYRATTVSDIARVAQVSKTVVYAHFTGKEQCLLELYSRATDGVLATVRDAQDRAREAGLPWRQRVESGVAAYLAALAAGPAVAWAALVEVQAAGRRALTLRRAVVDRTVDLLAEVAEELARDHPEEVRPVGRPLVVAAVGGINELMLARVERGEAARLPEDTAVATALLVALLERRGRDPREGDPGLVGTILGQDLPDLPAET
jgi:AcrR family transcriptional regulator